MMDDGNTSSNLVSQMVPLKFTLNHTSSSMERNLELDILYKAVVQGIVLLCLASLVGGLMVLFICLKIIRECKVENSTVGGYWVLVYWDLQFVFMLP